MSYCNESTENFAEKFIGKFNGKFNAAFAHEVKNPISLIKAHIEFLELDNNLSAYKNNINIIKKELNKISELVSDFMLFDKNSQKLEYINIIPIIEETIKVFNVYNNKNINFSFNLNCNKDYFTINARPIKISMLFSNIFKNAVESIKHTGNIQVILYLDNNIPVIDIIDDGEGLPLSIQDVSKPFFTSKKEGMGMGIPICKNILDDIGGKFEIFNNKDIGCTVRITL